MIGLVPAMQKDLNRNIRKMWKLTWVQNIKWRIGKIVLKEIDCIELKTDRL